MGTAMIFRFWGRCRLFISLIAGVAWLVGSPAGAAPQQTSQQDRARFVSIARRLEAAPLDSTLKPDLGWAMQWLTEAPDVSVTVCVSVLSEELHENYVYAGPIAVTYMLSIGAFAIEHPVEAKDTTQQNLAGLEGVFTAYKAILKEKPEARSKALDALLEMQANGTLAEATAKVMKASCPKR